LEDELAPLIAKRLVYNIILPYNSIGDKSLDLCYVVRKLYSKTRKELTSIASISTTSCKEKARPKALLIKVFTGDSARNRRLSCTG
jgi:hypothetical protein